MKRVVIIEDETPAAERLTRLVTSLGEVEILERLDSIEDAVAWFQSNSAPDLAFFDIQLADGKSFSIFEQVPVSCPVIFTTAFDDYAIQAFKVNSVDYLLKPVDEGELRVAWNKFLAKFKSRFLIKSGEQFKFILAEKVAYFFSDGGNTFLVNSNGEQFLLDEKLEKLESQIDPSVFHRISRKYIVSCDSISKISSYFNSRLILDLNPKSSQEVIVSRERVSEFKSWLDQ